MNGPAGEISQNKLRAELEERLKAEMAAAKANAKPEEPPALVRADEIKKEDQVSTLDPEDENVKAFEMLPDEDLIDLAKKNMILLKKFNRTDFIRALIENGVKV